MELLKGREAVNSYREEHKKGFHNVEKLIKELKEAGFNSILEFFNFSAEENIKELNNCYERVGECNRCGKCCKGCKHFISGECSIYKDRPQVCKDYPTMEEIIKKQVPKECSYKLKEIKKPGFDVSWE